MSDVAVLVKRLRKHTLGACKGTEDRDVADAADALESIAASLAASEQRNALIRAQTIEECAKVCDANAEYWTQRMKNDWEAGYTHALEEIAERIRALPTQQETGK